MSSTTVIIMIYILISLATIIARGWLFESRQEKWYKTLIPGYNKYILGKLANSKKLGLVNTILNSMIIVLIMIYVVLDVYLIQMYLKIRPLADGTAQIIYNIPGTWILIMNGIIYALLLLLFIYLLTYAFMMKAFSVKHNETTWWIFIWAVFPIIGYIRYSINKKVYMPNLGLCTKEIRFKKEG